MRQTYCCLNCGHIFIGTRRKTDGTRCPNCNGGIVPCTIGIDLASGESQTSQNYKSLVDILTKAPTGGWAG